MDPEDWKYNNINQNHTLEYVESKLEEKSPALIGPIILQHDTMDSTCSIQPLLIEILQIKGYNFVTIDECIGKI